MRKAAQLLFPIAISAMLAACSGNGASGGVTPAAPPIQDPVTSSQSMTQPIAAPQSSTQPSASIEPTASPDTATQTSASSEVTTQATTTSGTLIWKAGDGSYGKWGVANTYQCGKPSNSGSTFTFVLSRSGTSCGRNQANPLTSSGSTLRLVDGATYTWTFNYVDGTPVDARPGMGSDSDARSLVWQIHGYNEPDTPCTSLNFINGTNGLGGAQRWALMTCAGQVWSGTYSPGERDTFKIVARISETSTGLTQLYRNGVLVVSKSGANYHNSSGAPWWNFGPYKWRWELSGGGGSNMTRVNATIDNMTLTKN